MSSKHHQWFIFSGSSRSSTSPPAVPHLAEDTGIAAKEVVREDGTSQRSSSPRTAPKSPPDKVSPKARRGSGKAPDATTASSQSTAAKKGRGSLFGRIRSRPRPAAASVPEDFLSSLRANLFHGSVLNSLEQKQLLKALDGATTPLMFQTVLQEYEDALFNLHLPMSSDSQDVNLTQVAKDIEREFILINGQPVDLSSEAPLNGNQHGNGASSALEPTSPTSPSPSKQLGDVGSRTAALVEVLRKEVQKFTAESVYRTTAGDLPDSEGTSAVPIDSKVRRLLLTVCSAMARTGFGGDSYHAVCALVGHQQKLIRPVVKPNQGMTSHCDAAGKPLKSSAESGFDESLPIHIEFLPKSAQVQVTTSSVFDIHCTAHLDAPETYLLTDDFVTPLGRIVAVCHEIIDVSTQPPSHTRRLNISLMDSPEPNLPSVPPRPLAHAANAGSSKEAGEGEAKDVDVDVDVDRISEARERADTGRFSDNESEDGEHSDVDSSDL